MTGSDPGAGGGERGQNGTSSGGGGDGRVLIKWNIADNFCYGYGYSVYSQTGVTNPTNSLYPSDGNAAQLYDFGDQIVIDLTGGGINRLNGSQINFIWRRNSTGSPVVTVESSLNGIGGWTLIGTNYTISSGTYTTQTITLTADTRYLRIVSTNNSNLDLDAISYDCCTTPTLYSVTGGGPYCSGGSGVAVGLSNSEIGVTYQIGRAHV